MTWIGRLSTLLLALLWLTIESFVASEVLIFQFLLGLPIAYFFGLQYDKSNFLQKKLEIAQVQLNNQLNDNEEKYKMLFENANDLVLLFEVRNGRPSQFVDVNKTARERLGYSLEEFRSMTPLHITPEKNLSRVPILMDKLYKGSNGGVTFEGAYIAKNGVTLPFEFNVRLMKLRGKDFIFSIGRDIAERKRLEDKMRQMAYYDTLTDLPNRNLLFDFIEKNISRVRRKGNDGTFSVLFLDLDGFKEVNDELGHANGDRLLKELASRLDTTVRRHDLVSRLGGDEFIFVLHDANEKETMQTARRIISTIGEDYKLDGHTPVITASIGVSMYPKDGQTAEELIKKADKAMYEAKNQGKNTYKFC